MSAASGFYIQFGENGISVSTDAPPDELLNEYRLEHRVDKGHSLICLPKDYTVIDLETTGLSPRHDEIIELAAIRVRDGEVVDSYQQLVKPKIEIPGFITSITHITNEMVADAPSIADALPGYLDFIGSDVVVGHNVSFDVNFLFDNSVSVLGSIFQNDYVNTVRVAKRLVKLPHYRLADLCEYYGISRDNAHRALADCQMTNELVKRFKDKCKELGFDELHIGWLEEHRCEKRYEHHYLNARMIESQIPEEEIDKTHPLYGKKVVFTGALVRFKRQDAMQLVVNLGGINQNGVTKETDFLVLGNNDYCSTIKDGKSSKQKKAEEYMLKGTGISIMDEQTFYDMVEAGDD